jgi:hypothetical protein
VNTDGGQTTLYANGANTWGTTVYDQRYPLETHLNYWNSGRTVDASIGLRF